MSWKGVRRGCGCKGLAGICFEALEKGMRAMMQPRHWDNFFRWLIGTFQNFQQRQFGVDTRQCGDGWGDHAPNNQGFEVREDGSLP
eukprot:12989051-Ditylum_brightwellii.AAC.1